MVPKFQNNLIGNDHLISNYDNSDKPRVLLIDNANFVQFSYVKDFYEIFKIEHAPNAISAFELLKAHKFDYYDAIIFNINTPTNDYIPQIRNIFNYMDEKIYEIKEKRLGTNLTS